MEHMASLIVEQRKKMNLTQKQLAEKLGVTDKAVSKWERGAGYPDISILSALSCTLGLSVGELLGEEKTVESAPDSERLVRATLEYADASSKNRILMTRRSINTMIALIGLISIAVCAICNLAIQGAFTWSLYPLVSIVFAGAIIIPVIQFPNKGILVSLCLASVLIIPFLSILGILSGCKDAMLYIGTRASMVGIAYLWMVYLLFGRMKRKKYTAAGISLLLMIPAASVINFIVDRYMSNPGIDVWDIANYAVLALAAFLLLLIGRRRQS